VTVPRDAVADRGIGRERRVHLPRSPALTARSILLFAQFRPVPVASCFPRAVVPLFPLAAWPATRKMFRIGLKFPCNGLNRVRSGAREIRGWATRDRPRWNTARIAAQRAHDDTIVHRRDVVSSRQCRVTIPPSAVARRRRSTTSVVESDEPRRWRSRGSSTNVRSRTTLPGPRVRQRWHVFARAYIIPKALIIPSSFTLSDKKTRLLQATSVRQVLRIANARQIRAGWKVSSSVKVRVSMDLTACQTCHYPTEIVFAPCQS